MDVVTDDITLNINFHYPDSTDDKSFMTLHGWSEKEYSYMFDIKVCINCYHKYYYYFLMRVFK